MIANRSTQELGFIVNSTKKSKEMNRNNWKCSSKEKKYLTFLKKKYYNINVNEKN